MVGPSFFFTVEQRVLSLFVFLPLPCLAEAGALLPFFFPPSFGIFLVAGDAIVVSFLLFFLFPLRIPSLFPGGVRQSKKDEQPLFSPLFEQRYPLCPVLSFFIPLED